MTALSSSAACGTLGGLQTFAAFRTNASDAENRLYAGAAIADAAFIRNCSGAHLAL